MSENLNNKKDISNDKEELEKKVQNNLLKIETLNEKF